MRSSFVALILLVATWYATSASITHGYTDRHPQGFYKTLYWLPQSPNRFNGISRKHHLLDAIRHIVKAGSLRQDEVLQQAFVKFPHPWKPSIPELPKNPPVVMPVIGPSTSPTEIPIPIASVDPVVVPEKPADAIDSSASPDKSPIAPVDIVLTPEKPSDASAKEDSKEVISLPAESKEQIKQVIEELAQNVEQDIQKAAAGMDSGVPPKVTPEVIHEAVAKVEKIIKKPEESSDSQTDMLTETPAIKVAISANPDGVILVDVAEKEGTAVANGTVPVAAPNKSSVKAGAEALKKLILELGSSLGQLKGVIEKVMTTKK